MIDWYVIEYLYPESYKKFCEVMFPNVGVITPSILNNYDLKKLFQFFDNNGVFLNIEKCYQNQWIYHIIIENGLGKTNVYANGIKTTRNEIEIDGFIECFKLLDKKIRSQS